MLHLRTGLGPMLGILLLSGCMSLGAGPQQRILGEWRSSVGGFAVTVRYTTTSVQVDGNQPVPYHLDGNRLRVAHGGSQVRIVSFPSKHEMIQTDPMTGAAQHYERIKTR